MFARDRSVLFRNEMKQFYLLEMTLIKTMWNRNVWTWSQSCIDGLSVFVPFLDYLTFFCQMRVHSAMWNSKQQKYRFYGISTALLYAFFMQAASVCINHTFLQYPTLPNLVFDSILIRGEFISNSFLSSLWWVAGFWTLFFYSSKIQCEW